MLPKIKIREGCRECPEVGKAFLGRVVGENISLRKCLGASLYIYFYTYN